MKSRRGSEMAEQGLSEVQVNKYWKGARLTCDRVHLSQSNDALLCEEGYSMKGNVNLRCLRVDVKANTDGARDKSVE